MEESVNNESAASNRNEGVVAAKKSRLNEEILDLEKEDIASLKGAPLNLVHVDRYFYAPKTSAKSNSTVMQALQGQDSKQTCERTLNQAANWRLNVRPVRKKVIYLFR